MSGASQVLLLLSLSNLSCLTGAVVLNNRIKKCNCIGWQDAFEKHGANCSSLGKTQCDQFLMKLPNEQICISESESNYTQWCFVEPGCKTSLMKMGAKYKSCDGKDAKLGDLDPMQLDEWSNKSDIQYIHALNWAYPTLPNVTLSKNLLAFFGLQPPMYAPESEFPEKDISPSAMAQLKQLRKSGTPTLFYSTFLESSSVPVGIMQGKRFYWVNYAYNFREEYQLLRTTREHDATPVRCVAGCDEVTDPWWTSVNQADRDLEAMGKDGAELAFKTVYESQEDDACDCIGWQDAFKSHGADCSGEGEMCTNFLMKLPNEQLCINEWSQNWRQIPNLLEPRQWCYVSPTCKTKKMRMGAKYKWCSKTDDKLGDLDPGMLGLWAKAHQVRMGYTLFFAYPTMDPAAIQLTRPLLKEFGLQPPKQAPESAFEGEELSPSAVKLLKLQMNSSTPTIIPSKNGIPPFALMEGDKLFWTNFMDEEIFKLAQGLEGEDTPFKCVKGCEHLTVDPWWSMVNDPMNNGTMDSGLHPMPMKPLVRQGSEAEASQL